MMRHGGRCENRYLPYRLRSPMTFGRWEALLDQGHYRYAGGTAKQDL